MRKLISRVGASALVVGVAAAGVDTGAAIYAEYQLARHVRTAADIGFDPWVAILGFPFIPQAMRHRYSELEIKANGVEQTALGKVTLEATMHDIGLADSTWLMLPDADLPMAMLESRIIVDSRHLGAFIGIKDLNVQAPANETDDATGGTTESGISGSEGLVFTGTPTKAGYDKPVSVTVDLSIAGPDQTTLVITPTAVVTGPNTADQAVPEDRRAAILGAFGATIPGQRLPFSVRPTAQGARGSDVIIEGIAEDVTVSLNGFRR
ncbi:mannan chain length control protein LmeA [Mycolicibacterium sp.]|uniref:mannan chain length control protein LmeA n=1 Tax=Mycolicibacterium sp. TaxID=2320850 RepID=UPI0028B21468|nr:mannan chain length control protein LmeA [Mycolicibacterium sp.]